MKLLMLYINPTGRLAFPPNISMLLGYLRKHRPDYEARVFDTSFHSFEFGESRVQPAWTTGYFVPAKPEFERPPTRDSLHQDLRQAIEDFKPDLVAASVFSNQFPIVTDILREVKRSFPSLPTLLGGCHASFTPDVAIAPDCVDMICVGEGEEALAEVCDRIERGESLTEIRNVWTKMDGQILRTDTRPPTDLDDIGLPAWDAFEPCHLYQPFHGKYYRVGMVEFGRGCPYQCTYCANKQYIKIYEKHRGRYFRHRDPVLFVRGLKELKDKYGLELIYFQDGTFLTMSIGVLRTLADEYEKHINLPSFILTTANSITPERLELLRKMRCVYINMGIESGNADFRKKVLKRIVTNEQLEAAFRMTREAGIHTAAYNVIGYPFETRDHVFQTIELNRRCRPDSIYTQVFYPIEGCDLKRLCLEEGFFDPELETLRSQILDLGNVSLLQGLPMSRGEIHGLLSTFYLYARCPKALFPLIRLLEKDTPAGRKVIGWMTRLLWMLEPRFDGRKLS